MPTCEEHWSAQAAQVPTAFGRLMFVAGLRDSANGAYRDTRSIETYGEAETARVLADLHQRAFLQWHMLTPQQQRQDVSGYLQTRGNDPSLRQDTAALAAALAPSGAGSGELAMFSQSLGSLAAVTAGETGALAPAPA